jgi:hypothetical protein
MSAVLSVTILIRGTVFSLIEEITSDDGGEVGDVDCNRYGPLEPVSEALREFCLEELALCGQVDICTHSDENGNIGDAR